MKEIKGFIFDLDGTVYIGDQLIPGAKETISMLRREGKKILFLSNYPLETRMKKVEKLQRLGIKAEINEIINSSFVLTEYLSKMHKTARILPVAETVVIDELQEKGHIITCDPEDVDVVVISWDRQFNYNKLNLALQAVKNGAKMVATNPDPTCPVENGVVPDTAGMIGAIEAVTGKQVDVIVGKPSTIMANVALETLGLQPEECIMIGDRLQTDILMGRNAGMKTALVMTGITNQKDMKGIDIYPNYLLDSIAQIQDIFSNQ